MPSQHEPALDEVAAGQLALDAPLALQEPVHGRVEILGHGAADVEVVGQGGGAPPAGGGEPGVGLEDAGRDEGADEGALRGGAGADELGEAEAAAGLEHGPDGAVGARAD